MPNLRRRKFRLLRKRAPQPLPPTGVQLRYLSELKALLAYARALVGARLLPILPDLLDKAAELRGDTRNDANPARRINKMFDRMSEAFYKKFPQERLEKLTKQIAEATSEHQKAQLFRQVKSTIGIDLPSILDKGLSARVKQFTAENVALIKTLPQTYFDDIEKRVLAGMRAGTRHEVIATELEDRLGVAESRAKLIARDQVLKFNGELNGIRQQALGIESYIWRTVQDNRVREEHAEREGQIYKWGEGEQPGEEVNCRCFSEPDFSALLGDS